METSFSNSFNRDRVFPIILLVLIAFRATTGFLGLQFSSIYVEEFYWGMTSLVGVIWLISSQKRQGVIIALIGVFALFYCFLFIVFMYFTWLFVGAVDPVKPETFAGTDQKVWREFHQGSWGGEPYETLGIGKSYFGGLMHREDACLKVNLVGGTAPWAEADNFVVPDSVDVSDCIFWKQKCLLFDMKNKVCYTLKAKENNPLSRPELQCKSDFEEKWNASLTIEKGMSVIEPLYAQSNTIYVQVNFKDPKKGISLSNVQVEEMTTEFCRAYVPKSGLTHSMDSVIVFFKSHDSRELYESDFQSKDKYARFSIQKNAVIPCKEGSDFKKKLVIPWSAFLIIPYEEGRNNSQRVWSQKLGCELHHLTDDFKLKKSGKTNYMGLNCEVYKAKHPEKLHTPNGYLTGEVTYFMYAGELVKAEVNYSCYPTNKNFTYKEVVDKITHLDNGTKKIPDHYRFVSTKYLDFYYDNGDNTEISCHTDTTAFPWKVNSVASIIKPEFVYLYRENQ